MSYLGRRDYSREERSQRVVNTTKLRVRGDLPTRIGVTNYNKTIECPEEYRRDKAKLEMGRKERRD